MLRGTVLVAFVFLSAGLLAQSLEERVLSHGFLLHIDDYEQHIILAKNDSYREYVAIFGKLTFMPSAVYDYWAGEGDRKDADAVLASREDLASEIWAVTSKPRYYPSGDWSKEVKYLHTETMRRVARHHRLLAVTAAEDGRHDDVLNSLHAMKVVAGHTSDQPGMLGELVARSVEGYIYAAVVRAAAYFADDMQGLKMLTDFSGTLLERPPMNGLRTELPLTLSLIEQLVNGKASLSDLLSSPLEQIDLEGLDDLLPFVDAQDPLRDRYLRIMLRFAEAWGDHASVVKVQEELDTELDEDTEDMSLIVSNIVMSALVLQFDFTHGSELAAGVRIRMNKIGLAAMEMRRTSGNWPSLDAAAQTAGVDSSDPFGGSIHYLPSEDSLTMYSNGRDMVDDGGKRREGPGSTYDSPIVVFQVSD